MKKLYVWCICALACLMGALVLILVVWVFLRFPCTAPAVGGLLLCAAVAALLRRCLTLRFAPCRVGEKLVEQFVRNGKTVHFFCFSALEDLDTEVPDITFSGVVRRHEGLKQLEFTDVSPERAVAWIYAHLGAELTAAFVEGGKGIWLTGTLEGLRGVDRIICGFQINVHTVKLTGCSRMLSV